MSSLDLSEITALYRKAIIEDDIELIEALNDNVDLDLLTYKQFLKFIAKLVKLCYKEGAKEICEYILSNRDNGKFVDTNTRIPLMTAIFSIYFDDEIYEFIKLSLFGTYVYIDHMINLLHADSSEEIVAIAATITDLYGEHTYEEYAVLIRYYSEHEDAGNKKVYNFIVEAMKDVAEYASVPYYMRSTSKETKELDLFRLAQSLIPETLYSYIPYLKQAPPTLSEHIIDYSIGKDLYAFPDDLRLFQILGPRNPKDATFYDDLYSDIVIPLKENSANPKDMLLSNTEDICTSYGGCRMLTCIEFEKSEIRGDYNNEEIEGDIEFGTLLELDTSFWFRGACDLCAKKIAKKRYAYRMALLRGGWRGCYCSLICVLNDIPDRDAKMQKLLNETNTRYFETLKEFGLLEV